METIGNTRPNANIVDFLTGRLTKAVDVGIERFAMQRDGTKVIGSTESNGTPPQKIVADDNLRKERNTSNIDTSVVDPKNTSVNLVPNTLRRSNDGNILPIAIGGGLLLVGLVALVAGMRGGRK